MKTSRLARVVPLPARGQITLPTEFRKRLGLAEGDLLQISLAEDRIEIRPVVPPGQKLREYTEAEIQQFLDEDRIDEGTAAAVRRLLASGEL